MLVYKTQINMFNNYQCIIFSWGRYGFPSYVDEEEEACQESCGGKL